MPQGDEFIVKSTQVMADDLTDKDVFEDMFSNEANKVVDEVNVMVAYDNNSGNEQVDPSHEDNAPPVSKDINSSSHKDAREQDSKRLNFHPLQIGSSIKASRRCRASQPAVDLMTGAMGILLPKLDQLLKEQNQQPQLKKDIESIRGKLRSMHACVTGTTGPA